MPSDRREHTTSLIRQAAIDEFTDVGARAFTLRDIADRAHVSNGAVYQRWPDKASCVRDLVGHDLPLRVAAACDRWASGHGPVADLVRDDLTSPESLRDLRFMAECVLAARDEPALAPEVRGQLARLAGALSLLVPEREHVPAIGWWATSTWLAYGLLRTSGCPVPDAFIDETGSIMTRIGRALAVAQQPPFLSGEVASAPVPMVERAVDDPTTQALISATAGLIEDEGLAAADARSIAERAGVTTGALYRRFNGKSEMLAEAFRAGLGPDRYAWTDDFLALLDDRDFAGVVRTLTEYCQRIWTDTATAKRLLEFTVAAHTDEMVRLAIFAEMARVAQSRTTLFASLIDSGIVRGDLDAHALAWGLQVPTVGMRLTASIGFTPDDDDLEGLLGAYLVYLVTPVP